MSVTGEEVTSSGQGKEEDVATEDEEDQEQEEANKAIAPKIPIRPTQDEVDAHMLTHLPLRSWCPHCVRGKSKGKAHRKRAGKGK